MGGAGGFAAHRWKATVPRLASETLLSRPRPMRGTSSSSWHYDCQGRKLVWLCEIISSHCGKTYQMQVAENLLRGVSDTAESNAMEVDGCPSDARSQGTTQLCFASRMDPSPRYVCVLPYSVEWMGHG